MSENSQSTDKFSSSRFMWIMVVGGLLVGFGLGYSFAIGQVNKRVELSPYVSDLNLASVVSELRAAALGSGNVTATVFFAYPLPIEDGVERWAVSGSLFREPIAAGHSPMRQKVFVVITREDDQWGSTDWNISTAESYSSPIR